MCPNFYQLTFAIFPWMLTFVFFGEDLASGTEQMGAWENWCTFVTSSSKVDPVWKTCSTNKLYICINIGKMSGMSFVRVWLINLKWFPPGFRNLNLFYLNPLGPKGSNYDRYYIYF